MDEHLLETILRRERRRSISVLGIDVMITPENAVRFIEINGAKAGSKGLQRITGRKAREEMWEFLTTQVRKDGSDLGGKPLYVFGRGRYDVPGISFADMMLVKSGAARPLAPVEKRRALPIIEPPDVADIEGIVWNQHSNSTIVDETRYLVINPFSVAYAAHRKDITHELFYGMGGMPRSAYAIKGRKIQPLQAFLRRSSSARFVMKPLDGSQGRGVEVIEREDIEEHHAQARYLEMHHAREAIIEELVESKPLKHHRDNSLHAGCMRYLVMVQSKEGRISIQHFGGYWRLAPDAIDSSDLQKALVANFSTGALPEHVNGNDLELVRAAVNKTIPRLYRRMLRLPLNERPDGIPIKGYCFGRTA